MIKHRHLKFIARIVSLLLVAVFFLAAELVSVFMLPPPDELDKILNVLQQNPHTIWQVKPGLNTLFQGVSVQTNRYGLRGKEVLSKGKNTTRILCLGASPTFGWGVEEQMSYPRRLESLLQANIPKDRKVEVINGGIIGFSSYQGARFLKQYGLDLEPDIITISYVVNDVDKHRFFRNNGSGDSDLKPPHPWIVAIENVLGRSRFVQIVQKSLNKLSSVNTKYYGKATGNFSERRRVSAEEYEQNIKEMVRLAKANNIKVVLIKMPVQKPFENVTVDEKNTGIANTYFEKSLSLAKNGSLREAVMELDKAISLDPRNPRHYYYMGYFLQEQGKTDGADHFFEQAKKYELLECAELSLEYNQIMEKTGLSENVPVIDVTYVFREAMKELSGPLYIAPQKDLVHPNEAGHQMIASLLFNVMSQNGFITPNGTK